MIIQQCKDVVKFTIHLHTNLHSVNVIENLQRQYNNCNKSIIYTLCKKTWYKMNGIFTIVIVV